MNTLTFTPTDVLFFRDGRPMEGASPGHGSGWPMPHTVNAALHAALHRADIEDVHLHATGRSGDRDGTKLEQRFGSLTSVGPFPVDPHGTWLFPRPEDAQCPISCKSSLLPMTGTTVSSSLKSGLYPVLNMQRPDKGDRSSWWTREAWEAYLNNEEGELDGNFVHDAHFMDTEHQIGIGIDRERQTVQSGAFYSAHYLRLREGWRLGLYASAEDKTEGAGRARRDLIKTLLQQDNRLLVGGQQRFCTAEIEADSPIQLPVGPEIRGTRVKWTLLTPSVFPIIGEHPGGWLPSWVDAKTHEVQLLDGPGKNKARRSGLEPGEPIKARLVAAVVTRNLPVSGFSIGSTGGAKSAHLAVPAGSVYYFETDTKEDARKLSFALNWHGELKCSFKEFRNRRSTLFGEKGFGLGVCSSWQPYSASSASSANPIKIT